MIQESVEMYTCQLTTPIKHGDKIIDELSFRAPTMKDIRRLGLPLDVGGKDVKMDVFAKYIETLCALPPSVVDQISASDTIQLMSEIVPFFAGSARA